MVKKRRRHISGFKFRVALEALEDSKTMSQLFSENEISANQIRIWKRQLPKDGPRVFNNHERLYGSPDDRTHAGEHFVLCSQQTARGPSVPPASIWMHHISPVSWSSH